MRTASPAHELVPRLYAAACGEAPWTDFLERLVDQTGARFAHVLSVSSAQRGPRNAAGTVRRQWIRHVGFSDELLRVLGDAGQMDPWLAGLAFGEFSEGWVGRGSEIVALEEVVKTDYFQTIMKPNDIWHAVGAVLLKRPGEIAVLGLIRGEMAGEFEDGAVALARELAPHLASAVRVYTRVGELEDTVESLDVALEQFAIGVAVLDRANRVMFANAMAERQLDAFDLISEQRGIRAIAAGAFATLRTGIEQAIRSGEAGPGDGLLDATAGVMALRHEAGSALHVFAVPWRSQRQVSSQRPAAILLMTEPDRRLPRETWVQALYGLTAAEARLAVAIGAGMDGPEAARTLGLSAETVRSRLKTIFNKTDTKRQSDLARLLARLPQG